MLHWRIQLKKDSGQSASPGLSSQARPGNLFRDSTYRHATNPTVVDYLRAAVYERALLGS